MSQPFVGEIRQFGGNFAPRNWMFCNGQLVTIAEYEVLFTLIGTTYGGDGQQTFALPDLRGRLPIGEGTGSGLAARTIGDRGGAETVTLTLEQVPAHSHPALATTAAGNLPSPTAVAVPATPDGASSSLYSVPGASPVTVQNFLSTVLAQTGGGGAHANMMPYLCVSFIISMFGIFPQQN